MTDELQKNALARGVEAVSVRQNLKACRALLSAVILRAIEDACLEPGRDEYRQPRIIHPDAESALQFLFDESASGLEIYAEWLDINATQLRRRLRDIANRPVAPAIPKTRKTSADQLMSNKQRECFRENLERAIRKRDLMKVDVHEIGLATDALDCLVANGIWTIGELCKKTDSQLREMPEMSRRLVRDIQSALSKLGISLIHEERDDDENH